VSDRIAQTPIVERPDLAVKLLLAQLLPPEHAPRCFMMNGCRIIVAEEPRGWHLSISRHDRDPSWSEIATARYRLLDPHLTFAMFLPPLEEYVNLHPYTFHLHEDPPRDKPVILRVA
jgi:hypothetical protein